MVNPQPTGVIVEELVGPNTVVPVTSLSSPLQVHNGFSLLLSEQNYPGGIFSATIISFTAPTACYTVAMDSTSVKHRLRQTGAACGIRTG
jgi:hypothetical protein